MLKQYFKRIGAKRMVIMLLGNVFLGMGVSIFKLSEMGTDPFSGMVMALAEVLGIGYPVFLILVNLVLLFVEVKFGREMIGAGTVVNACLLGYIVTFFYTIWVRMFGGVPTIIDEMNAAGLQTVIDEAQKQLDAFFAN